MKDEEIKFEEIEDSHTLGGAGCGERHTEVGLGDLPLGSCSHMTFRL